MTDKTVCEDLYKEQGQKVTTKTVCEDIYRERGQNVTTRQFVKIAIDSRDRR